MKEKLPGAALLAVVIDCVLAIPVGLYFQPKTLASLLKAPSPKGIGNFLSLAAGDVGGWGTVFIFTLVLTVALMLRPKKS